MLTKIETQILNIIIKYIEDNGYSPTVREVGEIVGFKSSSTGHRHLKILESKGYIERKENFPRALKVLKMAGKVTS